MSHEAGNSPEAEAHANANVRHFVQRLSNNTSSPSQTAATTDQEPPEHVMDLVPDVPDTSAARTDTLPAPVASPPPHQLPAVAATRTTSASPTRTPTHQYYGLMTPPPPFFQPRSLRSLRPHERLAADIPRPHTKPRHTYHHPPTCGIEPSDTTDLIPGQEWAAPDNLPVLLGALERPLPTPTSQPIHLRYVRDACGDPALGACAQPLYDLPILGPGRISTRVEAWRVAMWMCYDNRVTVADVCARMACVQDIEALQAVEASVRAAVVAWCEENCGFAPGRARARTERDGALVRGLSRQQVLLNTVWEVFADAGAGGMVVRQPGGSRFGAVWRVREGVLDPRFEKRVLEAWAGLATPAEDPKGEGWLRRGVFVQRECPPLHVVECFGMHWALRRWYVPIPTPPVQPSYLQSLKNASDRMPGHFFAAAQQVSIATQNAAGSDHSDHRRTMLLEPTQPQKPRATQSTWLVNPERSPRTIQSLNATSVHPEAPNAAQTDRASNVHLGNSSTGQSGSFSNIQLPRQDHALPVAASSSPFHATADISTFSGTPLLVVQPNGAAKVEGPMPSPSAFASHPVNNPAPYPSNSILIDPELFRQAHAHLSDGQLAQAHADASRREEKQILMQMLIDRRQDKLQFQVGQQ